VSALDLPALRIELSIHPQELRITSLALRVLSREGSPSAHFIEHVEGVERPDG
jgi:hypothetical protein